MTHHTARERAATAAAQAAIARAWTHVPTTQPDHDDDQAPAYITPAIARTIRLHIEETRRHGIRPDRR